MKMEVEQNSGWLIAVKIIFWIVVIIGLFYLFDQSKEVSNLEDKITNLENTILDVNGRADCLENYADYLQERLKIDPKLRVDPSVEGALSVNHPAPSCS